MYWCETPSGFDQYLRAALRGVPSWSALRAVPATVGEETVSAWDLDIIVSPVNVDEVRAYASCASTRGWVGWH